MQSVLFFLQEIGWKNVDEARRIIIFVTDAYPHIAGDGRVSYIDY